MYPVLPTSCLLTFLLRVFYTCSGTPRSLYRVLPASSLPSYYLPSIRAVGRQEVCTVSYLLVSYLPPTSCPLQWDAKKKKYVRETLGLHTLAGSMEGLKARTTAHWPYYRSPPPTTAYSLRLSAACCCLLLTCC